MLHHQRTPPKPQAVLIRGAAWCITSSVFLDVSWSKVADLRDARQYVSPFRYAQVIFWAILLAFWIRNVWNGWRTMQEARTKVL